MLVKGAPDMCQNVIIWQQIIAFACPNNYRYGWNFWKYEYTEGPGMLILSVAVCDKFN